MTELLLLAIKKIENNKWYLYVMETVYHKFFRISKTSNVEEIRDNWRIGFTTEVQSISLWSVEENTYITRNERLVCEYNGFQRLLLNKASWPDKVLDSAFGMSYGIVRLRELEILEKGNRINASVWGRQIKLNATVLDPWWVKYWKEKFSTASSERYRKYLSASKRNVFAFVENNASDLVILKLMVL